MLLVLLLALGGGVPGQVPPSTAERSARANAAGVLAYEEHRYSQAVSHFEEARALDPSSPTITRNLARALHARATEQQDGANISQVVSDLRRAIALDDSEPVFALSLADVWRRQRDSEEARRTLLQALKRHSGEARIYEVLGRLEYQEEHLLEALEYLEVAARLDPLKAASWRPFLEKVRREAEVEKTYFRDVKGNFTVKYDDREFREVGQAVLNLLESIYQRLSTDFAHWPDRRITVVLYTRGDYDSATGARDWTGGLFDGKIRLPVRNFRQASRQIEATLAHELSHLFVRSLTRHCPLWLNEGLAQFQEGKRSLPAARDLLSRAHAEARLPRMTKLPDVWSDLVDRALVEQHYAQALSFTEYLIHRFGWSSIRSLLGALPEDGTFAAAFSQIFGLPLVEVEDDWRATL